MAVRYIVQKREIKERHGKRPQLMGPYRTVYSDIKPPFDLSDQEKIESHLLRKYGEGRYQVKAVGKQDDDKKSTIKMLFSGDIERYRPRAKQWTKQERIEFERSKWVRPKKKIFSVFGFFIAYLIACWLFFATLGSGLDSSLTIVVVIAMVIVFMAAVFFIDMMHFETE
jgi:hypothetical protein